jgi:hypothetical protein
VVRVVSCAEKPGGRKGDKGRNHARLLRLAGCFLANRTHNELLSENTHHVRLDLN